MDVFVSELQTLSFIFLTDSMPVLNIKNDPNERIFLHSERDSGKWGQP